MCAFEIKIKIQINSGRRDSGRDKRTGMEGIARSIYMRYESRSTKQASISNIRTELVLTIHFYTHDL